ncbi:MAG: hypothetical protein HKN47_06995 [Pirellulaceae bacterium]|nr:hypothetical protein [Pirellulaceae bacterium]
MNDVQQKRDDPSQSNWISTIFGSALRCHLIIGFVSLLLVAANAWVWRNGEYFATDSRFSKRQVDEAIELISQAPQLRSQYSELSQQAKVNEAHIDAIRQWLPAKVRWEQTQRQAEEIARLCDVQLVLLQRDPKPHTGVRVSVVSGKCRIRGSYANVCRFLHALAYGNNPVWCDSISILRGEQQENSAANCDASMTLRLPYAGEGTIAENLIVEEIRNDT